MIVCRLLPDNKITYQENQLWDELNDDQKAKIEQSIRQFEEGQGLAHEDVMAAFKKRYSA